MLRADRDEEFIMPLPDDLVRGKEMRLLTEAEVAKYLRVSRDAIRRFRRRELDPIPCMKIGRRYLYDVVEVRRYGQKQAHRAYRLRNQW